MQPVRSVKNTWGTSKRESSHLLLCNLQGNFEKLNNEMKRNFEATEATNSETKAVH